MSAESNKKMMLDAYEAFGKGDAKPVIDALADTFTWRVPGHAATSGVYRTKQEVAEYLEKVGTLSGGTFQMEINDLLASDEHVVALVFMTGHARGKSLQMGGTHVWRLQNGKIVDVLALGDDEDVMDDFWS